MVIKRITAPAPLHILRRKLMQKKKISKRNDKFMRCINTGADLSLTHIYDLKRSSINDIYTNNIEHITNDILYVYAKLLELDISNYEKAIKSKSSSSSRTKPEKKKIRRGGTITFNTNDKYIEGFLQNQFIFDNKHDFTLTGDSKKYSYSASDIRSSDNDVLVFLNNLISKDERYIFFNLLQRNILIIQNILYITFNTIDTSEQTTLFNNSQLIADTTNISANIVDFFEQTLQIVNAKYITDGKLNVKTENTITPAEILFNSVAKTINDYLKMNSIYTIENCYDSLSINIPEAYVKFNEQSFKDNIEKYAFISSHIFEFEPNILPPTVNKSIFKAFREETCRLFNVVYYKKDNDYKAALLLKATNIVNALTTLDKRRLILLEEMGNGIYQEIDPTVAITTTVFYAFDLNNIKNFNSPKNITLFISSDFDNSRIAKSGIKFIYSYVYKYYEVQPSISIEMCKKYTANILFDLKKAGDMCKMLFAFYYNYIKNSVPAIIDLSTINIPAIGFTSNDKLAALNSIFKQANNVFFCDKTTNTIYVYNNTNGTFNMNILYLWLNKYFCLDKEKYDHTYNLFQKINDNIDEFNDIFIMLGNNSKEITRTINSIILRLYNNNELATINLISMSTEDKRDYSIYIHVLLLCYLKEITGVISLNFINIDNNKLFTKLLFKKQNDVLELIVAQLFQKINLIFTEIFQEITAKIIRNITVIDLTDPIKLHEILNIINNILTIVYVFLYVRNKKDIKVISEINSIKQKIADLFANKYKLSDIRRDQDIFTTLKKTIKQKVDAFRIAERKENKKKRPANDIDAEPNITIGSREIEQYVNKFIVKVDIINYIMIFNRYYEYFINIINYLSSTTNYAIDIRAIISLIEKIKLIYFYIYVQIYTENKLLLETIDDRMELQYYYENVLSKLITGLSDPINIVFKNFKYGYKPEGITGQSVEDKEKEIELIGKLQEEFETRFKYKIELIKQSIETLTILNFKSTYNLDILNRLIFLKDERLPTIDTTLDDQFKLGNPINTTLFPMNKYINIYNLLLFNIDPSIVPAATLTTVPIVPAATTPPILPTATTTVPILPTRTTTDVPVISRSMEISPTTTQIIPRTSRSMEISQINTQDIRPISKSMEISPDIPRRTVGGSSSIKKILKKYN